MSCFHAHGPDAWPRIRHRHCYFRVRHIFLWSCSWSLPSLYGNPPCTRMMVKPAIPPPGVCLTRRSPWQKTNKQETKNYGLDFSRASGTVLVGNLKPDSIVDCISYRSWWKLSTHEHLAEEIFTLSSPSGAVSALGVM